jgi:Uncharacterized protein conserved in bacteria (DUF2255)
MSWTPEHLARIDAAREIEIAVRRADGTLRPWTPIWVVHVLGFTDRSGVKMALNWYDT